MSCMPWRHWVTRGLLAAVCCLLLVYHSAGAETLQSNGYKFEESTIGAGGLIQSNSANYQGSSILGDVAIGNSASANYQVNAGNNTPPDPALTFSVDSATGAFPAFSPTAASTATTQFSVTNYTTYGYAVQLFGSLPTNGSHSISGMSTTAPSQIGIEQFGLNLVANTLPTSLGANPVQTVFGQGVATSNYNTTNQYRFVSGETIATAPKDSGKTSYTISYIINVSSLTHGGQYSADQTMIVTGTY